MSESPALKYPIDASHLSRFTKGRDAPIWWGIVGLIAIELTVVSAFTVSYFYLVMVNETWPPEGTSVPSAVLPTITLVVMLVSCGTMYLAGKAINANRVRAFVICTFASVFLACSALAVRWVRLTSFEVSWDENVYGSLLWTLTGFHFLHIVSAAIGTAVIGLLGVMGYFNRDRQIGVVVDTLYWNFVALAWVPFYFVLYWSPRIF
jgi:cytochrome c oxidase subunit 3